MADDEVPANEDISPRDVAAYIFDVAGQLKAMAGDVGLKSLLAPLQEVERAAGAALQEKAAPDDAA